MSQEKRKAATKINEIQGKVQEVFFDLEEFKEHDTANAAKMTTIKLMDDIDGIRNRILTNGEDNGSGN